MTNESYSQPVTMHWEYAPSMFAMDPGQTYLIYTYGADPSSNGMPLGLTDAEGNELLPGARTSVRVFIGKKGSCDFLDVVDLGERPWYDSEADQAGNFALFRWTETEKGNPSIVGAETLEPGKLLLLGRKDEIFSGAPYPKTVQDEHVTIGIQGQRSGQRLLVRNHYHDSRTEVWNMQFGSNVVRSVLLGAAERKAAVAKNTVWRIGNTGAKEAIALLQEPPKKSKRRRKR